MTMTPHISGRDHSFALVQSCTDDGHGAEVVLRHLLDGLTQCGEGPTPLIISPRKSPLTSHAIALGLPVLAFPGRRDGAAVLAEAAARMMTDGDARRCLRSVNHMHAWTARSLDLAVPLADFYDTSLTATLHDHPRASHFSTWRRILFRLETSFLDRLVCVSRAMEQVMGREFSGLPAVTIRNGLPDLDEPPRPPTRLRTVGFIGMHTAAKGFAFAADIARRGPSNLCWRFYGEVHSGLLPIVGRLERDLGGRATFAGRVPTRQIFREIDLLLHCSREFDPFPTVLLESARSARPAISCAPGGAAEIIDHATTGWQLPPDATAIVSILDYLRQHGDAVRLAGENARRHFMATFPLQNMVRRYEVLWGGAGRARDRKRYRRFVSSVWTERPQQ